MPTKLLIGLSILTAALAQDQKHMISATPDATRTTNLSAQEIERGEYPSIVKLKGNVEIKTPVCMPAGAKGALVCDGYTVVRADEAEFHEDTGQIEARGNVRIIPVEHRK